MMAAKFTPALQIHFTNVRVYLKSLFSEIKKKKKKHFFACPVNRILAGFQVMMVNMKKNKKKIMNGGTCDVVGT